jgi:predicted nucleic acid-binding protein
MRVVVADTGPLRYLLAIGHIDILPRLFEKLSIPTAVYNELRHPSAPALVRDWATTPPQWLEVLPVTPTDDPALQLLDPGETAALTLGLSLHADLILIDDRKAVAVAMQKGFEVTGTLGVLIRASRQAIVDFPSALERLKQTNFHYREDLLADLLAKHSGTRRP